MIQIKDPNENRKLQAFNLGFGISSLVVIAGAYFIMGVDVALGALIGSAIVAFNLFISQRLVAKLIYNQGSKGLAMMAYLFKLTFSILVLFLAVTRYNVSAMGIIAGVSTVVIATLFSSLGNTANPATETETHQKND